MSSYLFRTLIICIVIANISYAYTLRCEGYENKNGENKSLNFNIEVNNDLSKINGFVAKPMDNLPWVMTTNFKSVGYFYSQLYDTKKMHYHSVEQKDKIIISTRDGYCEHIDNLFINK
ncbi:hypothetical protein [Cysteiniphilum halobium]|uniref:hypothetical protein n=1 Tax=Cysteiniphilum halobium TaxID=2219059 RepID=UPI000E651FA7|nr:hypothetical protein [Cysteiniphilum halobium]